MTDAAVQRAWRPWQWVLWLSATCVAVALVGLASWLVFTFGGVCGGSDNPQPGAVHELQALLLAAISCAVVGWLVVARFTGRWWLRASVSAAATVAWPLALLVAHLTVASWASVGLCLL